MGPSNSIQAIQAIQGWCMLLYYPQETVLSMGPTCILSGSQYWTKDTEHMEPWDILRDPGWLMIMGINVHIIYNIITQIPIIINQLDKKTCPYWLLYGDSGGDYISTTTQPYFRWKVEWGAMGFSKNWSLGGWTVFVHQWFSGGVLLQRPTEECGEDILLPNSQEQSMFLPHGNVQYQTGVLNEAKSNYLAPDLTNNALYFMFLSMAFATA